MISHNCAFFLEVFTTHISTGNCKMKNSNYTISSMIFKALLLIKIFQNRKCSFLSLICSNESTNTDAWYNPGQKMLRKFSCFDTFGY